MVVETDVVVVGAGLAGLQCARELRRRGIAAIVLEASDSPGGRVRTDVVDGFRCDRGFQLLNPAYPAVKHLVDLEALDMRYFGRGVAVLSARGVRVVADPLRHPRLLAATLRSGYVRPIELARLAAWLAPALGPVPRLLSRPDRSLSSSLDAARIDGRLRHEVLEPFLTGVLADATGASSARFVRLLLRSFVRAVPGIPAMGMQALPDQLTTGLDVRLDTTVVRIHRTAAGVDVETDGDAVRTRAVVVATDPVTAAALTDLPEPAMNGLQTWWFAADAVPRNATFLRVDGRGAGAGPVVNSAVMTAVAPTYAPAGRHLVQATTLLPSAATELDVRRHLAAIHALPTRRWELVVVHRVERALPAQPPPLDVRRPVDLGAGVFVAGDHRDTGSIQGALVSGTRAANAVGRALQKGRR